jgi:hypothetical protein
MARLLSTAAIAISLALGLIAQEHKVKERIQVDTDDARMVTWTGCLRASQDGFDLTEVAPATSDGRGKKSRTPTMVMVRHVPAALDLQKYVGRRVAITGAAEDDVFEDIELKVKRETTVEQKARADLKTTTKTEVEADPSGHNILVPVSVRQISNTCR